MSTLAIKELDTELQFFKRRFQFANHKTTKTNQVELFARRHNKTNLYAPRFYCCALKLIFPQPTKFK